MHYSYNIGDDVNLGDLVLSQVGNIASYLTISISIYDGARLSLLYRVYIDSGTLIKSVGGVLEFSNPTDLGIAIDRYKTVTVSILSTNKKSRSQGEVYKFLERLGKPNNWFAVRSFILSIEDLKRALNWLGLKTDEENATQALTPICSVCGMPDPWACCSNNKYYCYKHTPGF